MPSLSVTVTFAVHVPGAYACGKKHGDGAPAATPSSVPSPHTTVQVCVSSTPASVNSTSAPPPSTVIALGTGAALATVRTVVAVAVRPPASVAVNVAT